jgi:hypothetical protein
MLSSIAFVPVPQVYAIITFLFAGCRTLENWLRGCGGLYWHNGDTGALKNRSFVSKLEKEYTATRKPTVG